ncbi:thiopeptide-type bacteriocin biosynthesis domain-containing protein [Streptoalloteichus tenebrarius]|uniref:Thiopeptide-type bacteriocin biosynthesis domain-containing protein n=1 Tax=Streptoalloteichus tenebrarius (strain ATCC 17920 / DSM 40477 / JCM 4838 / CBS 697.72 / NBRC 16177 / NCIMB 11028 / NRRL B-12390 / A12253. 1 / ISP 5477) TaxID=1933 RepID=A0ABT1I1K2_STRSD|nr:thiopeptide-type bacteriocin biosynthesis domain-containing protein [Streptoalloteichus tenebrarius]BFE99156.1 hypothetical protein GCM10020241_08320 [Streptoalloteichus tenebrarius]
MRQAGLVGRLVFDTYFLEVGRYGQGEALEAAENVFVADSATVTACAGDRGRLRNSLCPVVGG